MTNDQGPKIGGNRGNAGQGRPKGAVNKTTAILKDAILQGAENAGGGDLVAYLTQQAKDHPGPYLSLIGKILPFHLKGNVDHAADDSLSRLLDHIATHGRRITDH
jgi:hypothetical protein